ncbi:MAG: GWxTD domain-containing protein [Bacteroidales bacterium]|jgi:GWxTD domain-containing protein|nr:GWxTD domain-containing protein [Bacteroidales bacterium]
MKKFVLLISILFCLFSPTFANIETYFMYFLYYSPESPYIETNISFIGNTLKFQKNDNGKFSAQLSVTISISVGDSIVLTDNYNLNSPEIVDSNAIKPNFLDIQRYFISNGIYNLKIIIQDKNAIENRVTFNDILIVNFLDTQISIGGPEYLEKITKSENPSILTKTGYDLIPYISNFFPTNIEKLSYYFEVYNTDKVIKEDFLMKIYLESYESRKIIEHYGKSKKMEAKSIVSYIGEFNIKDLKTGNYNFVIELVNKENKTIKKESFFIQRSNTNLETLDTASLPINIAEIDINSVFSMDMNNRDSLIEYVRCLRPIANVNENNFIDYESKKASLIANQNFFLEFWMSRDNKTTNETWKKYWEQILYVNRSFGSKATKGYDTDMGVIYLKYGAPDEVYESIHEPIAYPYQIWTYWRTQTENHRKFVFYNQNFAGRDYTLLHSNAKGEIYTQNWERYLQKRNNDLYDFNNLNADQSWGSRALEEFNK